MNIPNYAPINGKYEDVICLKNMSIIDIDWGNYNSFNIEVIEGKIYRNCLSGFGFLKKNICNDNQILIEIGGMLWPFLKGNFTTKDKLRDLKLKNIGI
jgi:hypothetical protein